MPTLLHCFSDNVGRFVSHAPYTIKIQKVVALLACREDTGKKKGEASQELLVKTPPAAAFLLLMVLAFSLHATEAFLRLIKILLNPLFFFFPFGYCNEPRVSRCQIYSKNHRENTPDRGLTMPHLTPFKLYSLNPYFIPSMYSLCFSGTKYVSFQQSALSVILYAKWLPPSRLMEYCFIGKNYKWIS